MGTRVLVFITDMASGGRQTVCRTLVDTWASDKVGCSLYVSYGGGVNLGDLDRITNVYVANGAVSHSLKKVMAFANKHPAEPCLSLSTEITVVLCFLKKLNLIHNPIYHRESMDAGSFSLNWRLLVKFFFPALSGLICTSNAAADSFRSIYRINHALAIIRNPCCFADNHQDVRLNPRLLLSVARLDSVKGHDRLLRAFAVHGAGYRLQVWGDGAERNKIEEAIEKLGLSGGVELCGETRNVRQVYSSGGIVVISSYREGLPNVMIEALLCGCRVVVPECLSGAVELLRDIGLGQCIVHGEYEENLFATLAEVVTISAQIFDEARARLARQTNSKFVCAQISEFLNCNRS